MQAWQAEANYSSRNDQLNRQPRACCVESERPMIGIGSVGKDPDGHAALYHSIGKIVYL